MSTSKIGRREFVFSSLAALGSVSLARTSLGAEKSPFGDFKMGAQSFTWRQFNLDQALSRMSSVGLGHVEFATTHVPASATPAELSAVLRLCKDHGITPSAAGVLPFSADTDSNRKMFEFGQALGVKVLSADPTPDAFDSLDKLCEEFKIAVAIHPHGPSGKALHRWYSAEIILEAVKDHHPLIGSCLDTGHLIRSAQPPFGKKLDPAQQIRLMGKRNFGVHLKDHDNEKREDVIFGQGVLDTRGVLQALKDVGFTGMISIEYEAKPEDPTDDVKACLEVVQKAVKELT